MQLLASFLQRMHLDIQDFSNVGRPSDHDQEEVALRGVASTDAQHTQTTVGIDKPR